MKYYHTTAITTKINQSVTFYDDADLVINLDFEWNLRVTKFALTCIRKLPMKTYEIKHVATCNRPSGQTIYVVHILENGQAQNNISFQLNSAMRQSLNLDDEFTKQLFVFVMHDDASYLDLNTSTDPDKYCDLNSGIPDSKDGSILIGTN